MSENCQCLCQAVNIILSCSRYVFILPLKSIKNKSNHLNIGCTFHVSKVWFSFSIVVQLLFAVYALTTTLLKSHQKSSISDPFEWYIMTTGCLIMEIDILTSLCFGTFKAKRIGKLFERISRLHGSVREMRSIRQQIQIVLMILLILFLLSIVSYFHVAYIRFNGFYSINWQNFSDSPPGILIRGIISIVMQIQCALVVTLCLLISSKFQYLAETIKITLERATLFSSCEQTNTVRKMNISTIKWTIETNILNFVSLEQISDQHQEAMHCLSEMNHCFGIQLLANFIALLFSTVYNLYRIIVLKLNEYYISNTQQLYHCVIELIFRFIKFLMYVYAGQKISEKSKEPLKEIQRGKLLRIPVHSQQQVQSLIMQWLSVEPCYLSAYNVINIGPWLLGPILANTITYLLVAIQLKSDESTITVK